MSKRIKACFDTPTPSEDLRQRVQTLAAQSTKQQKHKGMPTPMPLKIYTGFVATIIIGGLYINHLHPFHQVAPKQSTYKQSTYKQATHKHVTDKNAPLAADIKNAISKRIGNRNFCIYAGYENDNNEIMLIYSTGKKPEDALYPDKNNILRVLDSSIRTQDWKIIVRNSPNLIAVAHLPFQGNFGIDRKIIPERISPDGCKYEAIAFKFSKKPYANSLFTFSCVAKNLHGQALWEGVKQTRLGNPPPQASDTMDFTPLSLSAYNLLDHQNNPSERVPAAWAKYGLDIAEATRQLEQIR
jgi:hypothetical protein